MSKEKIYKLLAYGLALTSLLLGAGFFLLLYAYFAEHEIKEIFPFVTAFVAATAPAIIKAFKQEIQEFRLKSKSEPINLKRIRKRRKTKKLKKKDGD